MDQQQTCKMCGRPDKFNFDVSDDIWNAVVPPELINHVVCISCFDGLASRVGIHYAASLYALYFAGIAAALEFKTASAISLVGDA